MLDNMTGFTNYEFSMGAKWLEILKEIAPSTARVSLMLNPDTGSYYVDYLRSVEAVALSHSVQATLAPVHNSDEIQGAIATLGRAWTFRVIAVPASPLVTAGPYRYLRHPNYVGVVGELAAAALMTGAIVMGPTAMLVFGVLLFKRIRVEEQLLAATRTS